MISNAAFAQTASEPYFTQFNQPLETIRQKERLEEIISHINRSYKPEEKRSGITRFYFVRHGESSGNKERILAGQTLDVELTPDGISEAIALGQKLNQEQREQHWAFNGVFSSPSKRTRDTAQYILQQLDVKPAAYAEDKRLLEKHSGKFDGKAMDENYREMKKAGETAMDSMQTFREKFVYKFDKNDPKEESLQQVFDRAMDFMQKEHEKTKGTGANYLVASHCVDLKSLLMANIAIHYHADMEYHRFDLPNCSVLVIDFNDEGMKVVRTTGIKYRDVPKH